MVTDESNPNKMKKSGSHLSNSLSSAMLGAFACLLSPFLRSHSDFTGLFFKREGKELLGKGLSSFWILLSIMTLTFIAIGFSNGSLRYLEKKMSDPFINWVNIDIPWGNQGLASQLTDDLDNKSSKDKFGYASINGYYKYDLIIQNKKNKNHFRSLGRTIDFNNPLIDVIFKKENLISGRKFKSENDIGFIVTADFLKNHGYSEEDGYIYIQYHSDNSSLVNDIPLPVIAIVKELPDMAEFATTPYFYNQRYLDFGGEFPFNPMRTRELIIYIPGTTEASEKLIKDIENEVRSIESLKILSPLFTQNQSEDSFAGGTVLFVSFFPEPVSTDLLKKVFTDIDEKLNLSSKGCLQLFSYKLTAPFPYKSYDYLAVNFASLDKIRAFKDYLFNEHQVQLEMAQIESKENFNFVTKLTRFISLILLIFCIISITLFLSDLLRNHLLKIKVNIGTFKAFGMGEALLKRIYLSIIGVFITVSIILALLISAIVGYSGGIRLVLYLLRIELEPQQNYFALADWWTLLAIVAMLFVSLYAIYVSNNKIFKDTPGNLINKRNE